MSDRVNMAPPADVLGGGIVGLTTALELQERGFDTTIIDKDTNYYSSMALMMPEIISEVAGGQFLAIQRVDASDETQRRIVHYTEKSRAVYESLSKDPHRTGIMPIINVELFTKGAGNQWPASLVDVMKASTHELERPVAITGPDGGLCYYDAYYEFDSFSISMRRLLNYLRNQFYERGGRFRQSEMTRKELHWRQRPTVQAAGAGTLILASERGAELRWGYTETHQSDRPIRPVAISADDLLFMPKVDPMSFGIGAPYVEAPERTKPTVEERAYHRKRVMELANLTIDSFQGVGYGPFMQQPSVHAGQRVIHAEGPIVEPNLHNPQFVIDNMAHGSVGCTVAFGAAEDAAKALEALAQNAMYL